MNDRFTSRYGYGQSPNGPLIRESAPEELRATIISYLRSQSGFQPNYIRELVTTSLKKLPDYENNWGSSNIMQEVFGLIRDALWYQAYDVAEAIYFELEAHHGGQGQGFQIEINTVLNEQGLAWVMKDGKFVLIGDEITHQLTDTAVKSVQGSELSVATSELKEGLSSLSRRPDPDLSGAISHAMCSLESIARHLSIGKSDSLGAILKDNPGLVPKPLDEAIQKIWGYASYNARHGCEQRQLNLAEAQLIVGVSAMLVAYLTAKLPET